MLPNGSSRLEVLPFNLLKPAQETLIWYLGWMSPQSPQFYVLQDIYRLHLQDIYDHGFRSRSICEQDRQTAQPAVDTAEQIGFNRHVVFRSIFPNAEALTFKKLTPVLYLSNEIDSLRVSSGKTRQSAIAEHRGHGAYCEILK
jgi:hypothetical protein